MIGGLSDRTINNTVPGGIGKLIDSKLCSLLRSWVGSAIRTMVPTASEEVFGRVRYHVNVKDYICSGTGGGGDGVAGGFGGTERAEANMLTFVCVWIVTFEGFKKTILYLLVYSSSLLCGLTWYNDKEGVSDGDSGPGKGSGLTLIILRLLVF